MVASARALLAEGQMRAALTCLLVVAACETEPRVVVHVSFSGAGQGSVYVGGTLMTQGCTEDCSLELLPDDEPWRVQLIPFDTETKASCDGCNTDESGALSIGPFETPQEVELNVGFRTWVDAPLEFARSGAFTPDGDLVITTTTALVKVSSEGEVRWATRDFFTPPYGGIVEVAPSGDVYVSRSTSPHRVMRIGNSGEELWGVELAGLVKLTALPGGDLIVLTSSNELQRLRRTDGGEVWSIPSPNDLGAYPTMASSPVETIYLAAKVDSDIGMTGNQYEGRIRRFSAVDGAELGAPWVVPVDVAVGLALAVDKEGALLVRSHRLLRLDGATGAPLYDVEQSPADNYDPFLPFYSGRIGTGIVATSGNQALHWNLLISTNTYKSYPFGDGTELAAANISGVETWHHEIPQTGVYQSGPTAPNVVGSVTCRAGRCALFGPNMPAQFVDVP